MAIRVCVAGVSGWTGGEVARAVLTSSEFKLTGAWTGYFSTTEWFRRPAAS